MADEQMNDTWDASVVQANGINLKRVVDEWAAVSHNKAVANANLQDQINSQFLRWADDAHSVANLVANNSAVLANRANNLATTWDNLVVGGEIDTTAQGAMANNLADRMRSVAFEAVQAAMAQTAQTSAAAQGTTGVAHGAMQTGTGIADVALMAQIAKLAEAVNVIYLKVLGEENTAEKP
jgi:hypothetical protein